MDITKHELVTTYLIPLNNPPSILIFVNAAAYIVKWCSMRKMQWMPNQLIMLVAHSMTRWFCIPLNLVQTIALAEEKKGRKVNVSLCFYFVRNSL